MASLWQTLSSMTRIQRTKNITKKKKKKQFQKASTQKFSLFLAPQEHKILSKSINRYRILYRYQDFVAMKTPAISFTPSVQVSKAENQSCRTKKVAQKFP